MTLRSTQQVTVIGDWQPSLLPQSDSVPLNGKLDIQSQTVEFFFSNALPFFSNYPPTFLQPLYKFSLNQTLNLYP